MFPAPGVYDALMTLLLMTVSACTTPLNFDMPASTVNIPAEIAEARVPEQRVEVRPVDVDLAARVVHRLRDVDLEGRPSPVALTTLPPVHEDAGVVTDPDEP